MSSTESHALSPSRSPSVAIAGATGFIGRALASALVESHHVIGLTRGERVSVPTNSGQDQVEWRRADLFSSRETEAALKGASAAFYLVHSMMPSARLTQGRFEDLDLILADNFARACWANGVQRIIYLGGLVPDATEAHLSRHLRSRLEVEQTLGAYGTPVTALRAGLVVGRGGSSFQMMLRLVQRLPVMVFPAWTLSKTQPIDVRDVVALLTGALQTPETAGRAYDIGGPDVMTYREMLLTTAELLGRKLRTISVPFFSPRLSRLWVSVVSGSSRALVGPLVMSLEHSMVASQRRLQSLLDRPGYSFGESVRHALQPSPEAATTKVPAVMPLERDLPPRSLVRSVQRLPVPERATARWVAEEYLRWLPRFFRYLIHVRIDGHKAWFELRLVRRPLLELELIPSRSNDDRQLFIVRGGLLADAESSPLGRLEFRTAVGHRHVLAAIHDFKPRLPWWIYRLTQAIGHLWVMRAFGRHLRRQRDAGVETPAAG